MESLREAVERAVDDVIVELTSDRIRWRAVEMAAWRLVRVARELQRAHRYQRRI